MVELLNKVEEKAKEKAISIVKDAKEMKEREKFLEDKKRELAIINTESAELYAIRNKYNKQLADLKRKKNKMKKKKNKKEKKKKKKNK